MGILIGAAATDACFYILMRCTDWSLEAAKAAERVGGKAANSSDSIALEHMASSDNIDGRFALEDESETAGLLTDIESATTHQKSHSVS